MLTAPPLPRPCPLPADEGFRYVADWYATTEAAKPYNAAATNAGTCTALPATPPTGSLDFQSGAGYAAVAASPSSIMTIVSSTAPVAVYFYVDPSFRLYTGGVYQASSCASGTLINHAMTIVGYNAVAGVGASSSFWTLRNSWGTGWGLSGYAQVQMVGGNGACLVRAERGARATGAGQRRRLGVRAAAALLPRLPRLTLHPPSPLCPTLPRCTPTAACWCPAAPSPSAPPLPPPPSPAASEPAARAPR